MILPPPRTCDLPAGTQLRAGLGTSTVLADIDFETYSEAGYVWDDARNRWVPPPGAASTKRGLNLVGQTAYAMHPTTDILRCTYNLKDGRGGRIWRPGDPDPLDLFDFIIGGEFLEAWNSSFEHRIWLYVACRRYGWPQISLRQFRCAMAKARAHAWPGKLELAAKIAGCREHKLDGSKLLNRYSVPHNPTKKEPSRRLILVPGSVDDTAMSEYNAQDIVAEADVSGLCPDLTGEELEWWLIDQEINARGVALDIKTVDAAIQIVDSVFVQGEQDIRILTSGAVSKPSEVAKILAWLHGLGLHLDSLDDDEVTRGLSISPAGTPEHQVLSIRAACASAAVKKLYAFRHQLAPDGRVHDLYLYHGARTGRATGSGPQPANLPNSGPEVYACPVCGRHYGVHRQVCPWCGVGSSSERMEWMDVPAAAEDVIEIIRSGSRAMLEYVFGAGKALDAIAACLRAVLVAGPGMDLICSDYSSIEAVVLAGLANEKWRLDVFHGHGRIYEVTAADLTGIPFDEAVVHPHRKLGKVGELSGGYQSWIGGWKAMGIEKFIKTDEEIREKILRWRDRSPAIVHLWGGQSVKDSVTRRWRPERYGIEGAAINAIEHPGIEYPVIRLDGTLSGLVYICEGDVLYCRLPSRRHLTYHHPRLRPSARRPNELAISYEGWNTNPKYGAVGWVRMDTYGGKLTENDDQAISRDILRRAAIRTHAHGYPWVMHTYDEAIAEVPEGFGSVEEFEAILSEPIEWAVAPEGRHWPIRAKGGWRRKRYGK